MIGGAALVASLVLAQVPFPSASATPAPSPFDPARVDAMSKLADRLRTLVPYLEITLPRDRTQPLSEEVRDGFGVAWGPRRILCLSFLVAGAERIVVRGPRGSVEARVVLTDVERRVAILETDAPVTQAGLEPVALAPASARTIDTPVFALVGTAIEAHVLIGHVLDDGVMAELEGHPRVSLALRQGMPVFDDRARFVGYSRAVAWDRDTAMIVTPEHVQAAVTATTAARLPKPRPKEEPWWVR